MSIARLPRKFAVLVTFLGFYFYDLFVSSVRIAWDTIAIKQRSRPGIIDVPLDAKTDLEITLIANLITFSPGTMVVGISEDRRVLQVHAMFLDDPASAIESIKTQLEARVLEVLR
jgi:multicomponent Na+:H+ antiporter subunit E